MGAKRKNPAPPQAAYDIENSAGYLLNRAANIIAARFSEVLKPYDINLQTWRVLATLSSTPACSLTDLASHIGTELSYLSRACAAAQRRGLLVRAPSPTDARTVLLSLTPAGRKLVAQLVPQAARVEAAALSAVPAADARVTLRTLRAIYDNLVAGAEDLPVTNRKLVVAQRVQRRTPA